MKLKRLAVVILASMMLMCTGCTNSYTMSQEVQMWNTVTEATINRYNSAKEKGIANEEAMLKLLVFNQYDESLYPLFDTSKDEDYADEGRPDKSFIGRVRDYEREDAYDAYYFEYARAHQIPVEDLYSALQAYEAGDTSKDLSDFLFTQPKIVLHKFFTSMNTPTVTEVYKIQGASGSMLSVIILWKDDKILYVIRSV